MRGPLPRSACTATNARSAAVRVLPASRIGLVVRHGMGVRAPLRSRIRGGGIRSQPQARRA
ncbi:hypothetical protein OH807_00030 [Kitasatospora sp. NBC_01560]|uniref:hypothetical protein n=1 Tax=Kitasatospora sp. NBC_01560 TaxID=2975965 RepID=UPI00386F382E